MLKTSLDAQNHQPGKFLCQAQKEVILLKDPEHMLYSHAVAFILPII